MCVCPCLFEFFQRLLRPEDKLQRDVFAVTVRSTAGAQNMLCHFVQCGRADDPRVTQGWNDLILQQPADLKHREQIKKSSPLLCVYSKSKMWVSSFEQSPSNINKTKRRFKRLWYSLKRCQCSAISVRRNKEFADRWFWYSQNRTSSKTKPVKLC